MSMRRRDKPNRIASGVSRENTIEEAVTGEQETEAIRAKRVVVGVDGSPASMRALVWAAAEARMRSAALEIVHVDVFRHEVMDLFGPGVLRSEHEILDEAVARAKSLEPSVVIEARLCEPPAAKALVDASEEAELLVVGSSGAGGIRHLGLGSVSAECALHAKCPVVIVPSAGRWQGCADRSPETPAVGGQQPTAGNPD